jgi:hypothetical protein
MDKTLPNVRSHRCFIVSLCCISLLCLTACSSLKKAGIVAGITGTGAAIGSAVSASSVAGPAGAIVAAGAATLVSDAASAPAGKTVIQEAPTTWLSILQSALEIGGWAVILGLIIIPAILTYLIPGPLQVSRKKKHG